MRACASTRQRRRESISPAAPTTSGRCIFFTTARRRSTPPSACARAARSPRATTTASCSSRTTPASGSRRPDPTTLDVERLPLVARLVRHFGARGVEVRTKSDSPVGAGIAGSSAMNVALTAALAAWTGQTLGDDDAAHDCDEHRGAGHSRPDRRAGLPAGALRRRLGGRARRHRRPAHGAYGADPAISSSASCSPTPARRAIPASTTGTSWRGASATIRWWSPPSTASAMPPPACAQALEARRLVRRRATGLLRMGTPETARADGHDAAHRRAVRERPHGRCARRQGLRRGRWRVPVLSRAT